MSYQPQFVPPERGGPTPRPYPYPTAPPGYAGHPQQPPAPAPLPVPVQADQRPAVIAMAATMCVTASLLWLGGLTLAWLFAAAGEQALADSTSETDSRVVLLLNHFSARLLDGLAVPLYLIPLASAVVGFIVLIRAPWARWLFTAMGAVALAWTAWWLRAGLVWFVVPAGYIAVTVLLVWTPSASRWYRRRVG